jgi:pimeloyl-ACP methyl ester carboxylesterase
LIAGDLQEHRRLIVLNLPGHGGCLASTQDQTFGGLVDAVEEFLAAQKLEGADVVGSSLGGRMVLELARRGIVSSAIALDPGGFWHGWERHYVFASLTGTIKLIRGLGDKRKVLASSLARPLALRQLSHRPSALPERFARGEVDGCAAASNFEAIVRDLTTIPAQTGPAARRVKTVAIGWGRQDRLCFPSQAHRAQVAFPGSVLHWFKGCGHFPSWDQPAATTRFILETLRSANERQTDERGSSMQQRI